MKKQKYSVIVNVNLEYIVKTTSRTKAEIYVENVELPKEYVSGSFEIVKIGIIDKDSYPNYERR
jgi:hypothetical protein